MGRPGRLAVDVRDVKAYIFLRDAFEKMGIFANVTLHPIRYDMPPDDAAMEFQHLLHEKHTGAIICLGSVVACPLSDIVTRKGLNDISQHQLPVQIQWEYERPCAEFLASPGVFTHPNIGIRIPSLSNKVLPRSDDTDKYDDAGVLFLDCRPRHFGTDNQFERRVISATCIGHGGRGTIAAAAALVDQERIAAHLRTCPPIYGRTESRTNRVFEIVKVTGPIDEEVDDNYWEYVWDH